MTRLRFCQDKAYFFMQSHSLYGKYCLGVKLVVRKENRYNEASSPMRDIKIFKIFKGDNAENSEKTKRNQNMKREQQSMQSQDFVWHYDIVWKCEHLIEEERREGMSDSIAALVDKEKINLEKIKMQAHEIAFTLGSSKQINICTLIAKLQKKLSKIGELEITESLMASTSQVVAKEDKRLNKLIESIREVDYYDLDEGLIDQDILALKDYLKNRKLSSIDLNGQVFLIDEKALKMPINLNCFACTKRHQYGCCCGSPCAMSEKNMALLDRHILPMEEAVRMLDEQQYEKLMSNGGFLTANGKIKAFDGHCAFLVEEEGVYKCMPHKYALEQNLSIYELCPLSCLMYPLEILELVTDKHKKIFLLTAAVEEKFAERFSRWGSYESLEVELRCIYKEKHDELFKKEDYEAVYHVNALLIAHEFNETLVQSLQKILEETD